MTKSINTPIEQVQPGLIVEDASICDFKRLYPQILPFIVKPYLQLGDNDSPSRFPQFELAWHTAKSKHDWIVAFKQVDSSSWIEVPEVSGKKVKVEGIKIHNRYSCLFSELENGKRYEYRIQWQGVTVFHAEFTAPRGEEDSYRVSVVGDIGDGSDHARAVVHRLCEETPDLTVLAGDIVYKSGRFSEYLANYLPIVNSDSCHTESGAPFIRSHLVTASVGNHDVKVPKSDRDRQLPDKKDGKIDLFAYDLLWSHPANGPRGLKKKHLDLSGGNEKFNLIADQFGASFASKTNFSYSYGNSFWLHLDGNDYMNWEEPKLRRWICSQLASAQEFIWKFVVIHQPPFSCDAKYRDEQKGRLLCDIYEAFGVDIVFSGHCHLYERTFPIQFSLEPQSDGLFLSKTGHVNGRLRLDREFDGDKFKKTEGVIYITTGTGGHELEEEHHPDMDNLPPYSSKVDKDRYSISVVDIDGNRLEFKQVAADGEVIDRFVLEK